MNTRIVTIILLSFITTVYACKKKIPDNTGEPEEPGTFTLSPAARKVLDNIKNLSREGHTLVGHQGTTIAGAAGWRLWEYPDGNKSDFKDVCGKFPAIYGWEFSYRPDSKTETYDYISYDATIAQARLAFERGCINTFMFHPFRIDNNSNSWNNTSGYVAKIIPGGTLHEAYKAMLDIWVSNFKKLKDAAGRPFPFIARLYPEMDGNWFWWGASACTDEEYKTLFRFTVTYLREQGLDNMLVCYAPGIYTTESAYLKRYPGDDVVDILGFDAYYKSDAPGSINGDPDWNNFIKKLRIVSELALSRDKVAAVAETGQQNITSADYFSQLSEKIEESGAQAAYLMFWANYTTSVGTGGSNGFYVPYATMESSAVKEDFISFIGLPRYMAQDEHPDLYD